MAFRPKAKDNSTNQYIITNTFRSDPSKWLGYFFIILFLILFISGIFIALESKEIVTTNFEPFEVDQMMLKVVLDQDETLVKDIPVTNLIDSSLSVSVRALNLDDLVTISQSSLDIPPSQTDNANIVLMADQTFSPAIYVGEILFSSRGYEANVPVIVEVQSVDPNYDVTLDLLADKRLYPGSYTDIEVNVFNLNGVDLNNVNLHYELQGLDGEVLFFEDESMSVGSRVSLLKSLSIPYDIAPGVYVYTVSVDQAGKIASASLSLNIGLVSSSSGGLAFCPEGGLSCWAFILIFISLFLLLFFILFIILVGKKSYPVPTLEQSVGIKKSHGLMHNLKEFYKLYQENVRFKEELRIKRHREKVLREKLRLQLKLQKEKEEQRLKELKKRQRITLSQRIIQWREKRRIKAEQRHRLKLKKEAELLEQKQKLREKSIKNIGKTFSILFSLFKINRKSAKQKLLEKEQKRKEKEEIKAFKEAQKLQRKVAKDALKKEKKLAKEQKIYENKKLREKRWKKIKKNIKNVINIAIIPIALPFQYSKKTLNWIKLKQKLIIKRHKEIKKLKKKEKELKEKLEAKKRQAELKEKEKLERERLQELERKKVEEKQKLLKAKEERDKIFKIKQKELAARKRRRKEKIHKIKISIVSVPSRLIKFVKTKHKLRREILQKKKKLKEQERILLLETQLKLKKEKLAAEIEFKKEKLRRKEQEKRRKLIEKKKKIEKVQQLRNERKEKFKKFFLSFLRNRKKIKCQKLQLQKLKIEEAEKTKQLQLKLLAKEKREKALQKEEQRKKLKLKRQKKIKKYFSFVNSLLKKIKKYPQQIHQKKIEKNKERIKIKNEKIKLLAQQRYDRLLKHQQEREQYYKQRQIAKKRKLEFQQRIKEQKEKARLRLRLKRKKKLEEYKRKGNEFLLKIKSLFKPKLHPLPKPIKTNPLSKKQNNWFKKKGKKIKQIFEKKPKQLMILNKPQSKIGLNKKNSSLKNLFEKAKKEYLKSKEKKKKKIKILSLTPEFLPPTPNKFSFAKFFKKEKNELKTKVKKLEHKGEKEKNILFKIWKKDKNEAKKEYFKFNKKEKNFFSKLLNTAKDYYKEYRFKQKAKHLRQNQLKEQHFKSKTVQLPSLPKTKIVETILSQPKLSKEEQQMQILLRKKQELDQKLNRRQIVSQYRQTQHVRIQPPKVRPESEYRLKLRQKAIQEIRKDRQESEKKYRQWLSQQVLQMKEEQGYEKKGFIKKILGIKTFEEKQKRAELKQQKELYEKRMREEEMQRRKLKHIADLKRKGLY